MAKIPEGLDDKITYYWTEVGREVPRAIAQIIVDDYASAIWFSRDRYKEHYRSRSAPGHVRRDDIECDLLRLATQYRGQIIVDERPNRTRSSNHVEIFSPNRTVVTTVSKTVSPSRGPRQAVYRMALQMVFALPAFAHLQPPQDAPLYAPIFHGAKSAWSERPDFVYVVFAMGKGQYLPAINLLETFPDVLTPREEVKPVEIDENAGQPKLRLFPRTDKEEDQA